ncbi:MAG: HEPN domain-containing protein [Paracoccaceae bacterium]|nr:HEPN domain-containing protein [Paracoccaceae bacterium]MDE2674481.1 HEPN domain-containing protein [Paracoccaceae bacterium]
METNEDKYNQLKLISLLENCVRSTRFTIGKKQFIGPEQYGELYRRSRFNFESWKLLTSSTLLEDDKNLTLLVRFLQPFLDEYLDSENGRIGVGFGQFWLVGLSGEEHKTINEFARILIRMSARIHPSIVASHFFRWTKGEPIRFHTNALLQGVRLDKPIQVSGIRLFKFSYNSKELRRRLPIHPLFEFEIPVMELMGGVVISIPSKIHPALFGPNKDGNQVELTMGTDEIPIKSLDGLCHVISLACNGYISRLLEWRDVGELEAYFKLPQTGFNKFPRNHAPEVALSENSLIQGLEVYGKVLQENGAGKHDNLVQAIQRWVRSKQARTLADKLIELRIALESLYEIGSDSEKAFRIANYCAWHLGRDFNDRCHIRDTISKIYRDSSQVVHGGKPKHTNNDNQLLINGQNHCRNGILKHLGEVDKPDWTKLILGQDNQ